MAGERDCLATLSHFHEALTTSRCPKLSSVRLPRWDRGTQSSCLRKPTSFSDRTSDDGSRTATNRYSGWRAELGRDPAKVQDDCVQRFCEPKAAKCAAVVVSLEQSGPEYLLPGTACNGAIVYEFAAFRMS